MSLRFRAMGDVWKKLRNSFFAGLLVVLPVAASALILLGIFTWVTDFMLPDSLRQQMFTPLYRIIALVLFIAFTTGVGWVTRLVVGRRMVLATENIIGRVPLMNKTYGFMKEISHTVLSGRKTMFQRVVLVEFPRAGVYSVGFVTSEAVGEVQEKTNETVINVFVPTTPNPTSGFLILVPREQVVDLTMTVAEGMKMVISGGAVVPAYTPEVQQNLKLGPS
ncbi:MAG TPA: DUF502 domain-containing protein [Verrucomicrobiae bacterium]|nr:DUF502 domain-containing protein [Verrucomicrobiae bacterium]